MSSRGVPFSPSSSSHLRSPSSPAQLSSPFSGGAGNSISSPSLSNISESIVQSPPGSSVPSASSIPVSPDSSPPSDLIALYESHISRLLPELNRERQEKQALAMKIHQIQLAMNSQTKRLQRLEQENSRLIKENETLKTLEREREANASGNQSPERFNGAITSDTVSPQSPSPSGALPRSDGGSHSQTPPSASASLSPALSHLAPSTAVPASHSHIHSSSTPQISPYFYFSQFPSFTPPASSALESLKFSFYHNLSTAAFLTTVKLVEKGVFTADSIPGVLKHGGLTLKSSPNGSNTTSSASSSSVQKLYFALLGNHLYFFSRRDSTRPKGYFPLAQSNCMVLDRLNCVFLLEIRRPQDRRVCLQAPSEKSLHEWISTLGKASISRYTLENLVNPNCSAIFRTISVEEERLLTSAIGSVTSVDSISGPEHDRIISILSCCAGSALFARLLNMERCESQRVANAQPFMRLVEWMKTALLCCYESASHSTTRSLMNMSNTFFIEFPLPNSTSTRREYIADHVRDHKIWADPEVWVAMFVEAISVERGKSEGMNERARAFSSAVEAPPMVMSMDGGSHNESQRTSPHPPEDSVKRLLEDEFESESELSQSGGNAGANNGNEDSDSMSALIEGNLSFNTSSTQSFLSPSHSRQPSNPHSLTSSQSSHSISASSPSTPPQDANTNQFDRENFLNICFGQLIGFLSEMRSFRLSFLTASQFLLRICVAIQLPDDRRVILFRQLKMEYEAANQTQNQNQNVNQAGLQALRPRN